MCLLENLDCLFGHVFTTKAKQELGVLELREQYWKPVLEAREPRANRDVIRPEVAQELALEQHLLDELLIERVHRPLGPLVRDDRRIVQHLLAEDVTPALENASFMCFVCVA